MGNRKKARAKQRQQQKRLSQETRAQMIPAAELEAFARQMQAQAATNYEPLSLAHSDPEMWRVVQEAMAQQSREQLEKEAYTRKQLEMLQKNQQAQQQKSQEEEEKKTTEMELEIDEAAAVQPTKEQQEDLDELDRLQQEQDKKDLEEKRKLEAQQKEKEAERLQLEKDAKDLELKREMDASQRSSQSPAKKRSPNEKQAVQSNEQTDTSIVGSEPLEETPTDTSPPVEQPKESEPEKEELIPEEEDPELTVETGTEPEQPEIERQSTPREEESAEPKEQAVESPPEPEPPITENETEIPTIKEETVESVEQTEQTQPESPVKEEEPIESEEEPVDARPDPSERLPIDEIKRKEENDNNNNSTTTVESTKPSESIEAQIDPTEIPLENSSPQEPEGTHKKELVTPSTKQREIQTEPKDTAKEDIFTKPDTEEPVKSVISEFLQDEKAAQQEFIDAFDGKGDQSETQEPLPGEIKNMVIEFVQEERAEQEKFTQTHSDLVPPLETVVIDKQKKKVNAEDAIDPWEAAESLTQSSRHLHGADFEEAVLMKKEAVTNAFELVKKANAKNESFSDIKLKPSDGGDAIKANGDIVKQASLPTQQANPEFNTVQLRQSKAGDAIKSKGDVDKRENLPPQETGPEFSGVSLKRSQPVEKPVQNSRRASFSDVKLKMSGYGDLIKSGMDVIKEDNVSMSSSTNPEYSGVQLKQSKPLEKPKPRRSSYLDVPIQLKASGYGDVIKNGGDVTKDMDASFNSMNASSPEFGSASLKQAEPARRTVPGPRRASFLDIPIKLRESGFGDAIKSGGDVVKSSDNVSSEKGLSTGISPITEAKPARKSIVADPNASKPRKSKGPDAAMQGLDTSIDMKEKSFAGVKLRSAGLEVRLLNETIDVENFQASNKASPKRAAKSIPNNNSAKVPSDTEQSKPAFAGFKLKSTGHAEILKAGGDVGKEPPVTGRVPPTSEPNTEKSSLPPAEPSQPAYAAFTLKNTGRANVLRAGSDVAKKEPKSEKLNQPAQGPEPPINECLQTDAEPDSGGKPAYARFKLKRTGQADKIKRGGDVVKTDTKPLNSTKQAKTASGQSEKRPSSNDRDPAAPSKPAFAGFKLKSTGQAEIINAGGDVKANKSRADTANKVKSDDVSVNSARTENDLPPNGDETAAQESSSGRSIQLWGKLKKSGMDVAAKMSKDIEAETGKPAFAGVKLKSTGRSYD